MDFKQALREAVISMVRNAFRGIFSDAAMLAKSARCGVLHVYGFSKKLIPTSPSHQASHYAKNLPLKGALSGVKLCNCSSAFLILSREKHPD